MIKSASRLLGLPSRVDPDLELLLQARQRRLAFGDAREEDLLQVVLDVAEDRVEAADRFLEDPDAVAERRQARAPRSCPRDSEIEDRHRVLLTDAVDSTDALLDPHRVPRQVVVDQDVAELEVPALAAGLGGDQDLRTRARFGSAPTAASFKSGFSWPWKTLTVQGSGIRSLR